MSNIVADCVQLILCMKLRGLNNAKNLPEQIFGENSRFGNEGFKKF